MNIIGLSLRAAWGARNFPATMSTTFGFFHRKQEKS